MLKDFINEVDKLYEALKGSNNEEERKNNIKKFKEMFSIKKDIGEYYYKLVKNNRKKGIVYTPQYMAEYVIKNTISAENIIKNPNIKIVDPSCGAGNFIIPCFLYLRNIFSKYLNDINKVNKMNLCKKDIDKFIINNNIFGYDIDNIAIKILKIDLYFYSGIFETYNIKLQDFLLSDINSYFDIFIGNPPYVGVKFLDKEYSTMIKNNFKEIFKDKSDISYCFFKKSLDVCKEGGKISFITSRYFLEASSGKSLRNILKENTYIKNIIDFYGIRPFKAIGIDPMIIFLQKKINNKEYECNTEVIRPKTNKNTDQFYKSVFLGEGNNYNKFLVSKENFYDEKWSLISTEIKNIVKTIEEKCDLELKDICTSYQGLISGCDKAFVIDNEIIEKENLEIDIIKPWIKSSNINKNIITKSNSYIIYSDLIKDEDQYTNCLKHISTYKDKLEKRRECIKGSRKWYKLQWGRKSEIFEEEKIIFPFKASTNKFVLDKGSYFSADVYALKIKEVDNYNYDYEKILKILNSKIYEFYFKTFGKKLGDNLYEYYPNNIMKLKIPYGNLLKNQFSEEDLYRFFNITEKQRKIINNSL